MNKARIYNRGRQISPEATTELGKIFPDTEFQADELIEYLHIIQDKYGYLPLDLLQALALALKTSMASIYEVASFYHHFDLNQYDDGQAPELRLRICESISCEMAGSKALIKALQDRYGTRIKVEPAPCMGLCDHAPAAMLGKNAVTTADIERLDGLVQEESFAARLPKHQSMQAYEGEGGFTTLNALIKNEIEPDSIISELSDSGLRGLGGAGFPTGRKWDLVRAAKGKKLMAVNADEGEPGTFKDRFYLAEKPYQFIEGVLIAAKIVEAEAVYIYLRDEYPHLHLLLQEVIANMENQPFAAHTKLILRRGAGAYICGEESAMIESIEGKRGLPRHRPPYVAQKGLFGHPTLVNNVETLYWIPHILREGAKIFATKGINGAKGMRSYSVSGRIKQAGVKLVPAGVTVQSLIDDYCGGMQDGHQFTAYLPGGASGGILPASMNDIPLDFGQLEQYGSFVGSHAVVIFSDKDDMQAVVENLTHFFKEESCGQCTPCRAGCDKALQLMQKDKDWDKEKLEKIGDWMSDASICGLGQAAANPFKSYYRFFYKS